MIRRWLPFVAAVCFSAAGPALRAGELPVSDSPWEVVAECQMVALPQRAALPLIADLSDDAKVEAAFARLMEMIGREEATLAGHLFSRGADQAKLAAESVEEVKYPCDWDPPHLPFPVSKRTPVEVLKAWPFVGAAISFFETREVGRWMRIETKVSDDGQWITCNGEVQHMRFLRNQKFDFGILPSGERMGTEQPVFATLKNSFALRVRSGQRRLVGIHKLPNGDTMELFFLRVRARGEIGRLAQAEKEPPPVPATVRVEMQMVGVSVAEGLKLIPSLKDERTAPEAFVRVQEMIAQNKAELLGWPIVWLRSGPDIGVSHSGPEIRYATEEIPSAPPGGLPPLPKFYRAHWGPETPTAFETRNTGPILQAEAEVLPGGGVISLQLVAEFVRHLGFKEHRIQPSALGIQGINTQPRFWNAKTNVAMHVIADRPTLVGVFRAQVPEPHMELFILRVRADDAAPNSSKK